MSWVERLIDVSEARDMSKSYHGKICSLCLPLWETGYRPSRHPLTRRKTSRVPALFEFPRYASGGAREPRTRAGSRVMTRRGLTPITPRARGRYAFTVRRRGAWTIAVVGARGGSSWTRRKVTIIVIRVMVSHSTRQVACPGDETC
ncbi:hypothetical protein EVAR_22504_1 [Eumeta japonica]|uniref:Uncharacterized protein n=1 Tax=Eumeta variegata TaxID=151549 RepID=A0A4C1ZE89_EUMVA|nr:hypothetical protein EVAR_22504_1 [Eumeta japonica]